MTFIAGLATGWIPGLGSLLKLTSFLIGLVYPTYQSYLAIESRSGSDDTQWLTYWVVICSLQIFESFAWPLLGWIPFYGLFRLLAISWLVLPQFKGATFVYEEILKPVIKTTRSKIKEIPALENLIKQIEGEVRSTKGKLSSEARGVEREVVTEKHGIFPNPKGDHIHASAQ